MTRARAVVLLAATAVGLFLLVGGGIVIANGVPRRPTKVIYTGEWGAMPAIIGLIILLITAVTAWDEAG